MIWPGPESSCQQKEIYCCLTTRFGQLSILPLLRCQLSRYCDATVGIGNLGVDNHNVMAQFVIAQTLQLSRLDSRLLESTGIVSHCGNCTCFSETRVWQSVLEPPVRALCCRSHCRQCPLSADDVIRPLGGIIAEPVSLQLHNLVTVSPHQSLSAAACNCHRPY